MLIIHIYVLIICNGAAYGDIAYRTWWGTPLVSNREYQYQEFRFRHRAIDDHSLRRYYDYVEGMVRFLLNISASRFLRTLRYYDYV